MILSDIISNEKQRLKELYKYKILDTPPEKEYDELVKLAAFICEVPIALVTFIDVNRLWIKAKVGLEKSETLRENAFCRHFIQNNDMLIISDTTQDARFADSALVNDLNVRFFAGMPLTTPNGYHLGILCVIDTKPKRLSEEQKFALKSLSKQVVKQMELKLQHLKLKKSSERIQEQNLELLRLNNISNTLITIISHDLRNPISTMKGFLSLFENNRLNELEIMMAKQNITQMLDFSADLLENLVKWSVVNLAIKKKRVEPIRIDLMIEELIDKYKPNADQKKNTFINFVNYPFEVLSDTVMIRFILRNLIQNANKFTSYGTIKIFAEETETSYKIMVEDNGCGIHPEHLKQLFKWENRMSNLGTAGEKGAGLGLILCKELIESYQGKIEARSVIGKGSVFVFSFKKLVEISDITKF